MKIGIVVAMEEELEALQEQIKNLEVKPIYDLTFLEGKYQGKELVIVKCGIGKVNAARACQMLIDHYQVSSVINIGVAGSVNPNIEIGDVVIGAYLVQHDFDITAFGHEKGFITGVGKEIASDSRLINIFKNSLMASGVEVFSGIIASGDIFCHDPQMSLSIKKDFSCDCVEMEGAAIAQVCYLSGIPFVALRSISDVVNGINQVDFDEFLKSSSRIVTKSLLTVLEKM